MWDGDRSPYDVLGVTPDADEQEVRVAYRRNALKLHPDAGGRGNETDFLLLKAAYDLLTDPESREEFDRSHGLIWDEEELEEWSPEGEAVLESPPPFVVPRRRRTSRRDTAIGCAGVVFLGGSLAGATYVGMKVGEGGTWASGVFVGVLILGLAVFVFVVFVMAVTGRFDD